MADPRMMVNMMNAGVNPGKHESASSVLPLPLNLIALMIAHVRLKLPLSSLWGLTFDSSIALQILPTYAEHVESSTI